MADLPPKDSEDSPLRVSHEEEETSIPKKRLPTKVCIQHTTYSLTATDFIAYY